MKFIHLSDLHLGIRVNEFSLIEDQEYILAEILKIIESESPDAVIIAGDIYDKPVPTLEAVTLFDDFLTRVAMRNLKVFVISGNHDSPERIAFGWRLMRMSGVYMSQIYNGVMPKVTLTDKFGPIDVYMLPFVKPAHVRRYFPDDNDTINTYTDAVRKAVQVMEVDTSIRNVLVTHQFVTGAAKCESEEVSVGGSDNVDASVFTPFDYVALGHIHTPQNVGSPNIRYCGTPLKYSFSEVRSNKSVTVVEMSEKGNVNVHEIPLVPKRDMVELKGSYNELTLKSFYDGTTYRDDYTHITLTDDEDIPDAIGKLRVIYKNIMRIDYDNKRTRYDMSITNSESVEVKSPVELFGEFYEKQNNQPMSDVQRNYINELIEKIQERAL